jgi:hypothetical protein
MARYFVIAAVLVVGTFVGITAYYHYGLTIKVGTSRATMPPHASSSAPPSAYRHRGLRGDAPWALSALPECLVQTGEWKGPIAAVRAHVPRGAQALVPPQTLSFGDCTLFIDGDEAFVRRGDDRLRIPPHVRFYGFLRGLAMLRVACRGGGCPAVLRVYAVAEHPL